MSKPAKDVEMERTGDQAPSSKGSANKDAAAAGHGEGKDVAQKAEFVPSHGLTTAGASVVRA